MNDKANHPLKVFLCHASGDKPPVRELYKRLTAEGVDAWLDQEKLLPGQNWRVEIPRAVHEADVVVVCLSKKSITKEGYVQKEIKFALDIAEEKPEDAIFLIPARLEECAVPERLSLWQWVDLYEENGFNKLLRSLKLRADAVKATIEPASYVDSDKELDQRIKQLYTEGLAAFYTEDWDKACHRFQSVLREQPNHKNATEKIAGAERQRNLSKLYEQAMAVIRSEDWNTAIKTLEELSQKSANYKDAMQLLRNARKQKQLRELYTEAETLHAGQKWQALVKVFEQIAAIEPNYPDPNGLLASAQKEVVELKRLTDLNDLYSNAVGEIDIGHWHEARALLEKVHKSQTGFLETERLLRKVENEITKVEEQSRRRDQVDLLYEQAHGLIRSKNWRKALDKIEEIQQLDSRFEDKDRITEQAKAELAREEQEFQRQNELAAMYAESVRLIQEGKYQEALDKWQEVRAVDPKYPDRQWVQRTAKKKLAEMTKPVPVKPRFVARKSLWMGMTAFAVVAVGIIGIVLLVKFGPQLLSVPTSIASESKVAFSTSTKVPVKTSTPRPATYSPETGGSADPTMYDDFDSAENENGFDKSLWEMFSQQEGNTAQQRDGSMVLVSNGYEKSIVLLPLRYTDVMLTAPTFIETSVRLPAQQNGGAGIHIAVLDKFIFCHIWGMDGQQSVYCDAPSFNQEVKNPKGIDISANTWHTIRVELDPAVPVFSFYIDGEKAGKLTPSQAEKYKSETYTFRLWSGCEGKGCIDQNSPRVVEGYFDYVRIGALEDDPTLLFFDDFDGPALGNHYGALPTSLSGDQDEYKGEPNYSFEVLDQTTVLRLQNTLQSHQTVGWQVSTIFDPGTNPIRLEIRFNTLVQSSATSIDGFLNLGLIDGNNSRFDKVGLFAGGYGLSRNFAGIPFDFKDNTWYRLVLTGSSTQNIRGSLYDDSKEKELVGVTLDHTLGVFNSGIKIGLLQLMGEPDASHPIDVAIDWIRLTIIPKR